MNNSIATFPVPQNEPVKNYAPGTQALKELDAELKRQSKQIVEIPLIIDGREVKTGDIGKVVEPNDHKHAQSEKVQSA